MGALMEALSRNRGEEIGIDDEIEVFLDEMGNG